MVYDIIARTIRQLRTEQNLSQRQLADDIGVTAAAVSNWENSTNKIDFDSLIKLSQYFHMPISYFIGETPTLTNEEKTVIEKYRTNAIYREACYALLSIKNICSN